MNVATMQSHSVSIIGTGSYLPQKVLTNFDLAKMVDTSDEWITTRTGIKERHIAAENESASDMAVKAAVKAIKNAGIEASAIDMIVVGTVTPDMIFPNTACFVQKQIGAVNAFCFDVEAACSGFLYSMEIGRRFIETGAVKTALIIGTEKLSIITDWTDRTTCVLFGDGAGAVILGKSRSSKGIRGSIMGSDGNLVDLLKVPGGGSRYPSSAKTIEEKMHCIKMNGKEVFKHAVRCMCDAGIQVMKKCGCSVRDIKCIIPHQANMRIIQAIGERLEVSMDKFYLNLERVGNISSASIPVALDEAVQAGRIRKGDNLLLISFGGGFTWGAMLIEWGI